MTARGWDTPDGARGRCGIATADFAQHFQTAGRVRIWTDYGLGPDPYGHRRAEHNAALLGGRIYDLTARQFEPDAHPVWLYDDWFDLAKEWIAGQVGIVVGEVYTSTDRLRRTWRLL